MINEITYGGETTAIKWLDKAAFTGRVITLGGKVIPIPDDEIVCDLCSNDITEFPLAVMQVGGGWAVCNKCLEKIVKPHITDGNHRTTI